MADVISSRLIFDGGRKVIQSYTNVSDGTGDSTMIIDVGNLSKNSAGDSCTNVVLQKVSFNVTSDNKPIKLQWNVGGSDNVNIFSLSGGDSWDFTGVGGITNPGVANSSGDVMIVVPSTFSSGESVSCVTEWVKVY
mgnify:CR=1 FL=1|jgi:hypothetical protein|tara:strand:+ start:58 stop:465 length:408 start_codon:yes stop_codon:yes gene_type:complete